MLASQVVNIGKSGAFSKEDVDKILPVIFQITSKYSASVDELIRRLESMDNSQNEQVQKVENEINGLIQVWHEKVKKLGGLPKGLWLVDFDSGDGYFCWKYPEPELMYWHNYQDGFSKRVLISDRERSVTSKKELELSKTDRISTL